MQIKRSYKLVFFSLLLLATVYCVSYVVLIFFSRKDFSKFDITSEVIGGVAASKMSLNTPAVMQVKDQENPVNGVLVTKNELKEMESRKLVVVSINNHSKARPQYGLSRADLVLEVLAEGGITRYNAFFYQDQSVPKVGPIRSARSYMLEFFLGFDDPVFVHEGQASYAPQEKEVPEINTLRQFGLWGIESMQTAGSRYRDKERIKSAGYVHSLMTGFELINKEVARLGWKKASNITPLKFKFDETVENRPEKGVIQVKFTSLSTNAYSCKFEYDPVTNTYLRSVGGKADVDALDNTRIAPKNVIVEYHNYKDAMDGHSRIILTMIGEGEAYIFRDGQVIKGKWKKSSRTDRTKYYNSEGKEIEFNRGQIWVVNAAKTSAKRISELTYNGAKI